MKTTRPIRATTVIAAGAVSALLAGGTYALAAGGGTIHACASKRNGALRLAHRCLKTEKRVSWNAAGPPGAQGQQGVTGPAGPFPSTLPSGKTWSDHGGSAEQERVPRARERSRSPTHWRRRRPSTSSWPGGCAERMLRQRRVARSKPREPVHLPGLGLEHLDLDRTLRRIRSDRRQPGCRPDWSGRLLLRRFRRRLRHSWHLRSHGALDARDAVPVPPPTEGVRYIRAAPTWRR
jgi:hypothetical protein